MLVLCFNVVCGSVLQSRKSACLPDSQEGVKQGDYNGEMSMNSAASVITTTTVINNIIYFI